MALENDSLKYIKNSSLHKVKKIEGKSFVIDNNQLAFSKQPSKIDNYSLLNAFNLKMKNRVL